MTHAGPAILAFLLAADVEPIRDNSFLLEEAYNQEAGVVQHIGTYTRGRDEAWALTFTQEWPVASGHHQLSYTLAALDPGPGRSGWGDAAIHWRYQVLGAADPTIALAPRVSAIVPIGNEDQGLGEGAPGLQVNLPLSVELGRRVVTHVNLGVTHFFKDAHDLTLYNFGQSVVWHARPRFDVLVEAVFLSEEGEQALLVSPGIRWAHDVPRGLQIVPGIAVPLGLGASSGERAVFFYLSFEHAFRK